jgi:hypothetical protein
MKRLILIVAVPVAVFVGGCGGSSSSGSSDTAKVSHVVETAFHDVATGDGAGFCSLATKAGQATLAKTLPGYTCAKVVTLVSQHLSSAQKAGLLHAHVKTATVKGASATVSDADVSTTQGTLKGFLDDKTPTRLTKASDGSWKISG